ncbi:hypothetical protein BKA64DRAFT_408072 [Cadophora sp. MPI-SDFR-AT-0126]|nr:hypothetical protein BKA64DRAFT_408072 [Leotiomycetes sp. MPI-SDFR-AT-0126]
MNIKQLDAGTVNIEYFFLLAFLLALLAYIISAPIKPAEQGLGRARERFAERDLWHDSESMITAQRIFWKWMTRKSTLLESLDEKWDDAYGEMLEEHSEDDTAFTWVQVLLPFFCEIGRGMRGRMMSLVSRNTDGNQNSPREA